ncbi:mannitol dehydrogenase family protein [Blastococcus sp. SYSU DS0510]
MSAARLSRTAPAPPVRAAHLGLGAFFRAHQAWYTDRASDAGEWGIAAFTGRRPDLADALRVQGGLYTLVTRAADGDTFAPVTSVVRAVPGGDHATWLSTIASPEVRVLTTTITEAGYHRAASGGPDLADPLVARDVAALREDPRAPVSSAPARILAGLIAHRAADAGPIALVPCDNLPDNGPVLAGVLAGLAEAVDPRLPDWLAATVTTATTMVDRITPQPTDGDRAAVLAATRLDDRCPVVTEPFSEWVVSGVFPGGRPAWESAGAVVTDDVTPFEERKLWLLNGAHSLLAYVASQRGHATVADAMTDDHCVALVRQWWALCIPHLTLGRAEAEAYCAALLDRFTNPRMRHALAQIAADGSQKLPVRLLPVLRRERGSGRLPDVAVTVLAAWLLHLRGAGAPVRDVRAEELLRLGGGPLGEAVPAVLAVLGQDLADDAELVGAVRSRCGEQAGRR